MKQTFKTIVPENMQDFNDVVKQAKEILEAEEVTVLWDFNGIICIVNRESNLNLVLRDYNDAFALNQKVVGPIYLEYRGDKIEKKISDFYQRRQLEEILECDAFVLVRQVIENKKEVRLFKLLRKLCAPPTP